MIISTIASHSSLQIILGANREGFKTRLYASPKRKNFYASLPVVDELIVADDLKEILSDEGIIIPHGSFVAYLGLDAIENSEARFFGNKRFLKWETKFELVDKALEKAGIPQVESVDLSEVRDDELYFVRMEGPKGGSGHFIAYGRELEDKLKSVSEPYRIERFIDGAYIYVHFFYSPILNRLELLGVDERLVIADSNKRRPFKALPYTIVGNKAVALRESLLPRLYDYGLAFVEAMRKLEPPFIGPFALHFAYDGDFHCIGFASRIDGGSNAKHWYSALYWGEEMLMGERIAREIKLALQEDRLEEVVT
ncbi:5-formaminoimidazole-4-carboxamide-1-(beta)-D-ribofuranosyl 5'-monophosphate synthetase [Palaeococcus pacificus DY20341]|uniref:5-formaminoimidazole-4-carboxamide-1-(Beta)-D-ribofuranosyl 5'-monophosphate synthetase n=1 Tax=Palaeococcus pacificus DY20341 TaxID=1343739 RepID=A0A075LPF7_9EURY|nr:formate--phosphoribosylaminoimidazolecarboxamide ligase [Palaeococcus pacificus]AIF68575.1 5-formaminoimidazole-4-carboxamide-1-(beta)-D-ribofuranosyl 5'-monophosphate synthetase [Palaeococcus pacificus DY20341]